MPLLLVRLNDLPHLLIKPGVKLRQTHGDILMDRGFGNAEHCGRAADSRAVLGNIAAETQGTVVQRGCMRIGGTELLVSQKASLPMRDPLTGRIRPASLYAERTGNMHKQRKSHLCMMMIFTNWLAVY